MSRPTLHEEDRQRFATLVTQFRDSKNKLAEAEKGILSLMKRWDVRDIVVADLSVNVAVRPPMTSVPEFPQDAFPKTYPLTVTISPYVVV